MSVQLGGIIPPLVTPFVAGSEELDQAGLRAEIRALLDAGVHELTLWAAEALREAGVRLVLSSPMTRALHSAALLSRALDVPLQVAFDLHEWVPDRTYRWDRAATVAALAEIVPYP